MTTVDLVDAFFRDPFLLLFRFNGGQCVVDLLGCENIRHVQIPAEELVDVA